MSPQDERDTPSDTLLTPGVEDIEDLSPGAPEGAGGATGSRITDTGTGASARMGDTLDTYGVGVSNTTESEAVEEVASSDTPS
jgi:hypothetical protein